MEVPEAPELGAGRAMLVTRGPGPTATPEPVRPWPSRERGAVISATSVGTRNESAPAAATIWGCCSGNASTSTAGEENVGAQRYPPASRPSDPPLPVAVPAPLAPPLPVTRPVVELEVEPPVAKAPPAGAFARPILKRQTVLADTGFP